MPRSQFELIVRAIPHETQRYPTTGDWQIGDEGNVYVAVSQMGDWRYEALVGIHEAIEATLCKAAMISEADVTKFDVDYEIYREGVLHGDAEKVRSQHFIKHACDCTVTEESEPGDDRHAPYYKQHQLATAVERMMAAEMRVSWNSYEATNLALYEKES